MTEGVRRLEVDERRDREQRGVEALPGEHHRQGRLGLDDRVPGDDRVEPSEDLVGLRAEQVRQPGIELAPAALAGQGCGRGDAADAVGDLDELGQLRDPRRDRHLLALQLARPSAPVPLLVRAAERGADLVRQPELLGQRARHRSVAAHDVAHLAVTGEGEFQPDAEAVKGRVARTHEPHARRCRAHAAQLVAVLDGLHRDVVAEPLRLLVRVGVAAHVDQQGRVVDDRPFLLVEPAALREPQRDEALAQDVLHRLSEAEVDAERERRDEFRQPDVRTISLRGQRPRLDDQRMPISELSPTMKR